MLDKGETVFYNAKIRFSDSASVVIRFSVPGEKK